ITAIDVIDIPDHNILIGGFPCQAFSLAGVSKRQSLGYAHGLIDEERGGNLFYEIARILADKRPGAILLENVKNLRGHDKGNTLRVIKSILDKLNYELFIQVIDAQHYVPQHRERLFIVGFHRDVYPDVDFKFPVVPQKRLYNFTDMLDPSPDSKYTLSDNLWKYLQTYKKKHQLRGNGFGFGMVQIKSETVTRTLSARYHKDGAEILIEQPEKNPRRLTPRECARLMGYPEDFVILVSDTQAYRQFGNSVVVPVVTDIAQQMVMAMQEHTQLTLMQD
ncbi:MAG: DNA (cytosine-5-)-methyltransferase, partial [Aggregatilineales bacterium]